MKECGRAGHDTDNKVIRSMCLTSWINKDTDTHSEYIIRIAFSKATVVMRTRVNDTVILAFLLLHKDYALSVCKEVR